MIKELRIKVPTEWKEITVKQFVDFHKLNSIVENSEKDKIEFMLEACSIFTGVPEMELINVSLSSLKNLFSKIIALTNKPLPSILTKTIEVDGITYTTPLDISKITAGQYIDLMELLKDKENSLYRMNEVLAILFIPIGKKYDEMPVHQIAEIFYNKLTIEQAYPLTVFFCKVLEGLISDTKNYSLQLMNQKIMEVMKSLKEEI